MESTKYSCPECSTVLKVSKPLAPGKKLRCPKCDTLFAPEVSAGKAASPARSRPHEDDEDEDRRLYQFVDSGPAADAKPGKKKSAYEEPLKDRFPKSKRGPAMAKVVKPSNALLASGLITCLGCLGIIVYYLFPMIFSDEPMSGDEVLDSWLWIGVFTLVFIYAGLIIKGAVDMQNLDSYQWAMISTYMALVPFTLYFYIVTLPAGLWCLLTLRKKSIIEGFMEKKPEG